MASPALSSKLPEHYSLPSTNVITQDIYTHLGVIISGVLDVRVLKEKYEELVYSWPVLGGHLDKTTSPYSFTTGSSIDFNSRIIHKPLASVLPFDYSIPTTSTTATIRSFPNDDTLDRVFHFDTLTYLNLPTKTQLVGLRVTITDDATLLGLYTAHHLCDADSIYHIMKAYCNLINGKNIPTLILPPDADPSTPLSSMLHENEKDSIVMTESERKMADYEVLNVLITPILMARIVYGTVLKKLARVLGFRWKAQEKYIHLPGELVEKWRAGVQAELDQATAPSEHSSIQVTKNDVIAAWLIMAAYQHTPPSSDPIDFSYLYNYRPNLLQPAFAPSTAYLHSMVYNITCFTSTVSTLHSFNRSLTPVASSIRRMVTINKQSSHVRNILQLGEKNPAALYSPIAAARDQHFPLITSWTSLPFSELDFRGALVGGQEDGDKGKVVFLHPYTAVPLYAVPEPAILSMKDGKGGYWLRSRLEEEGWMGIREWLQ